ncbi:MAG: ABC transporter permease subunit [Dehalococcoidia bacterium]
MSTQPVAPRRRRFLRSQRNRRLAIQAALAAAALLFLLYMVSRALTVDLGLGFLRAPAGFALSNEWMTNHRSTESRLDAYLIGVWNTIRLVVLAIICATVLGVIAGVARLSNNWLVNRLGLVYVETIRNTPVLVQIIFWWLAVFLTMPPIATGRAMFETVWFSNRGIAVPWAAQRGDLAVVWVALLLASVVAAVWVRRRRVRLEDATGQIAHPNRWGALTFLGLAAVTFLATGMPYGIEVPEVLISGANIQRYQGGLTLTPQFAAVFVALTTYTGAFIAEIVRGSIQALPRGQGEAAEALGFTGYQRMTLIILPQALRIMIPALTNQYLNLTKNSSLAIVVGYSELFFVSSIIVNNAGHAVPMFALVIVTYQAMSLLISVGMNALNDRVRLATR